MRGILIVVAFALAALPAWAQTKDDNWRRCGSDDFATAIGGCTALIQSGQDVDDAYCSRGSVYYKHGLYNEAIADFTRSLAIDPNSTECLRSRGQAYEKAGQRDKAIADYRAWFKLESPVDQPEPREALERLGATP